MKQAEIWLPVVGFENWYWVSDLGRVKSRRKVLAAGPDAYGYPKVSLCRNGVAKTARVATLVMAAFVGPRPMGMEIRHFPDRNPANCSLANLSYGTHSQNEKDKIEHGTHQNASRMYCRKGKHPLFGDNLIVTKRQRVCRECARQRQAEYNQKLRDHGITPGMPGARLPVQLVADH